ncbi:AI-2E family transporter [Floridanema aerugineum]|uniref:AI-2E family transporter n=1 Tax=Floridaenema aerugineum BLCC-F46 TaxID=3153654 RepID=A0ABV4X202_9CYAN
MARQSIWDYLKLVMIAVGIVGLFLVLGLFLWAIADVILLLFTGVLFAVILRTLAKPIVRYTPLTDKWALAVVLLVIVLSLGIGGWLFIPEVINQADQLVAGVREAINRIESIINQNPWTQRLFGGVFQEGYDQFPFLNIMPRITGTLTN